MKKEMNHKLKIQKLKNMKRYLLIFALLLGTVCSYAQSKTDQAQVMQLCIDLPELQSSFAKDASGNPEQLSVMLPEFPFSTDLVISKFGKPLNFLSKEDLNEKGLNNYLIIGTLEVGTNNASVVMIYYRNATSDRFTSAQVDVELKKSNNTWSVVTSNIEKN